MKKIYLMGLIASAALTMTSCSNDEVSESQAQAAAGIIDFGTYLGRDAATRGAVIDTESLKEQGFGVFGNYVNGSSQSLFNNTKVTWDATNTTWKYDNQQFWPETGYIDFYAYAPYTANMTMANNGVTFTIADKASEQKDILVSAAALNRTKANNGEKAVEFVFKHALSRIGFKVDASNFTYEGYTMTIKKIELVNKVGNSTGFQNTATLKLTNDGTTAEWNTKTDNVWSNYQTSRVGYSLETSDFANGGKFEGKSGNPDAFQLNKETSYLMILPQDYTGQVAITYDLVNANGVKMENQTATADINLTLEPGKAYSFNFDLVPGDGTDPDSSIMKPINFSATVEAWEVETDKDLKIE